MRCSVFLFLLLLAGAREEQTDGDAFRGSLELDRAEHAFLGTQYALAHAAYARARTRAPHETTVFSPFAVAIGNAAPALAEKLSAALTRRANGVTLDISANTIRFRCEQTPREGLGHATTETVSSVRIPLANTNLDLELYAARSLADAETAAWTGMNYKKKRFRVTLPRLSLQARFAARGIRQFLDVTLAQAVLDDSDEPARIWSGLG